jgi:hypothetical protein
MRGKIKYLVAASLAVSAMWAVAAASASAAAPEFAPESGTFPINFTSTSGASTLETTGGETVTCESSTGEGSITGEKASKVKFHFKGCTSTFFGLPVSCKSSGAEAKEIVTKELSGELGISSADKTKVVNDLKGEGEGQVVAEFECGEKNTVKVTGSVIAELPATETFVHETEMVLKQSKGINEFTSFFNAEWNIIEAVLKSAKNGGTAVQSGEARTDKLTFEKERKVKIVAATIRCAASGEKTIDQGRYTDNACTKPKAGGEPEVGEYFKVVGTGIDLKNGTECVASGEPLVNKGRYTDNMCTQPKAGGKADAGEYVKVTKK